MNTHKRVRSSDKQVIFSWSKHDWLHYATATKTPNDIIFQSCCFCEGGGFSINSLQSTLSSATQLCAGQLRHQPTDRLVGDSSVVSSIIYEVADKREVRKKAIELDLTGFQPERVISR